MGSDPHQGRHAGVSERKGRESATAASADAPPRPATAADLDGLAARGGPYADVLARGRFVAGADDEQCQNCGSENLRGRVLPAHRGAW